MAYQSKILDISVPCDLTGEATDGVGTRTVYYGLGQPATGTDRVAGPAQPGVERLPDRLAPMTLGAYFGEVLLLDVSERAGNEISYADLAQAMEPFQDFPGTPPVRFLIRTGAKEQAYLTSDALLFLHSTGAVLVGLDTHELDSPGANVVEEFLRQNKIVWVLNLDLAAVDMRARYTLTVFPVLPNVIGVSPARAVLIEDSAAQE